MCLSSSVITMTLFPLRRSPSYPGLQPHDLCPDCLSPSSRNAFRKDLCWVCCFTFFRFLLTCPFPTEVFRSNLSVNEGENNHIIQEDPFFFFSFERKLEWLETLLFHRIVILLRYKSISRKKSQRGIQGGFLELETRRESYWGSWLKVFLRSMMKRNGRQKERLAENFIKISFKIYCFSLEFLSIIKK